MLLGTLDAIFLGNMLAGKGAIKSGQDFQCCLIL